MKCGPGFPRNMKEYSSNLTEIKERIDMVNYKLSIVCYLIDEITKRVDEKTDDNITDKEKRVKIENKNKADVIIFYEQIQKLLSSSGNEAYTVQETMRGKPFSNSEELINIGLLKDYLPLKVLRRKSIQKEIKRKLIIK